MALVNGGFLQYMDMKKFLKHHLLRNRCSDVEKNLNANVPYVTLFKKCSQNFDPSINMALVNGGFLPYTDMKKFIKNLLLRNCYSDFEIISQECLLGDPFQILFAKF